MDSFRSYLPYTVGIARWLVFLLLKVVPAMFYRPYTSKTLERDAKRHEMLMKRGWYLRFHTGMLSGLGGGLAGLALAPLFMLLVDEDAFHSSSPMEKFIHSLAVGFAPGFAIASLSGAFFESLNIHARKKLMKTIRVQQANFDFGCNDPEIAKKPVSDLNESSSDQNSDTNGNTETTDNDPDGLIEPVPYAPSDVSVVVPVYEPPPAFLANMTSLIKAEPAKIYIVADITCLDEINDIVDKLDCVPGLVEVLPESKPGKRAALSTGLKAVRTRLTCFVDDDCQWCDSDYLHRLVKPFDNRTIGGVGSKQIMRPGEEPPEEKGGEPIFRKEKILEVMADLRLSVRYIDLMATTAVDRGCSCISGRTMCFRTEAISEEAFHHAFMHEMLWGIHLLSGDDKFLTRYIINKGYKTYHQLQAGCVLTTTFESRPQNHMSQLIRWSRNTWRSDITALFKEGQIWFNSPFTAFLLFDKLLTPFFLMYGFILIPIYSIMQMDYLIFVGWVIWLHFSRALKLVMHFKRRPSHMKYLTIWIAYQYLMGFVRMYSMVTMLKTHWGNRAVAVVDNEVIRVGEFANHGQDVENGEIEECHEVHKGQQETHADSEIGIEIRRQQYKNVHEEEELWV